LTFHHETATPGRAGNADSLAGVLPQTDQDANPRPLSLAICALRWNRVTAKDAMSGS
jgi:hypothetical protein